MTSTYYTLRIAFITKLKSIHAHPKHIVHYLIKQQNDIETSCMQAKTSSKSASIDLASTIFLQKASLKSAWKEKRKKLKKRKRRLLCRRTEYHCSYLPPVNSQRCLRLPSQDLYLQVPCLLSTASAVYVYRLKKYVCNIIIMGRPKHNPRLQLW